MGGFFKRYGFTFAVIVCVTAAYVWPHAFLTWGNLKLTTLIVPLMQVIMFGMGTTLSVADFTRVFKSPLPIFIGAALQYTIMPLIGFSLAHLFGLEGELAAGVILIGSVAGGVASNVMAYIAHANVALSVSMTCVSTLLAPVMTPLLMRLLAGRFVSIDAGEMALSILSMVLAPVLLGLLAHAFLEKIFPKGNAWMDRALSWLSMAGICFILAVILAPARETVKSAGLILIVAAVIHNALGFALGYGVSHLINVALGTLLRRFGRRTASAPLIPETDCRTIAIEVGMQNGGMGTALAINVLKSPIAALAPNIFGMWMNIAGSILANYWNRRPPKEEAEV